MLKNQRAPPHWDRSEHMNARYDKSFKTLVGSSWESSIPHLPANNGSLVGKRVHSKGARQRGFLEKPPQTLPARLTCPWRHRTPRFREAEAETPLCSPVLPRSSSGISGRQQPQQSPWVYGAQRPWGQLILCCSGGGERGAAR